MDQKAGENLDDVITDLAATFDYAGSFLVREQVASFQSNRRLTVQGFSGDNRQKQRPFSLFQIDIRLEREFLNCFCMRHFGSPCLLVFGVSISYPARGRPVGIAGF